MTSMSNAYNTHRFLIVISVGFVEQRYTFVENQSFGIIQIRKSAASDVPFQVRVIGGERK